MVILKKSLKSICALSLLSLTGCGIGYVAKSSYGQFRLMNQREPIKEVLKKKDLDPEVRRKLALAEKARKFAVSDLKLKPTDNYKTYVQLEKDYVTWIVRASPIYELKSYEWWYPFVGSFPYKGYFNPEDAEEERKDFDPNKYDTFVRGVSAYSTLGWFDDPLLSSMTRYNDEDLVNVIIHETVHATIYFKGNATFNESVATYIGNKGTQIFYQKLEGDDSKTLQQIQRESWDDRIFSSYITAELDDLEQWYQDNLGKLTLKMKAKRLGDLKTKFLRECVPQLKTKKYLYFSQIELNNARLMSFRNYYTDLSEFDKVHDKLGGDFNKLVSYFKGLEKEKDPLKAMKQLVTKN